MSDYTETPEPSGEPEREATPAPFIGYRREGENTWFISEGGARIVENTVTELNNLWTRLATESGENAEFRVTISNLRTEQIQGDDPRLADFWAKAQELADKANHCEVFDQIAEALGGPSRFKEFEVTVDFYVTVPVSLSISVEARDEYDACEQAIELAQGYGPSDLENNADFWNSEIQRDTFEAEASEV